jgi:hypothetical protein
MIIFFYKRCQYCHYFTSPLNSFITSNDEMVTMEKVIEHAARAIEKFVETSRFDHVMNEFNGGQIVMFQQTFQLRVLRVR